jgi:hypothetical protein
MLDYSLRHATLANCEHERTTGPQDMAELRGSKKLIEVDRKKNRNANHYN